MCSVKCKKKPLTLSIKAVLPEADLTSSEIFFFSLKTTSEKMQAVMGVCFAVSLDFYCQNQLTDAVFNSWWHETNFCPISPGHMFCITLGMFSIPCQLW